MVTFEYLADVLGLRATAEEQIGHSTFALIARIEGGLPVAALERVARLLAPDDVQFKYRIVPKATYERRKLAHKLSADESARLARVARVWALTLEVWQGDDAARDFLFRPHPMIEDKRPVDVIIQSEFGAELVIDILGRLKYCTAA